MRRITLLILSAAALLCLLFAGTDTGAGGGTTQEYSYESTLPVIYIDSETAYDDVTRDELSDVTVYLDADGDDGGLTYPVSASIRLRGNSTAELDKHPFKLIFDNDVSLLGMDPAKNWVLLANATDSTLIRNQMVFWLSESLGAGYTVDSRQAVLIYNGEYCGIYQICEQISVGDGQALIEMDFRNEDGILTTNYLQPFEFKHAEDVSDELAAEIAIELQALEYAIHDTDFTYHCGNTYYYTSDEGWCDYSDGFARKDTAYEESSFVSEEHDGLHYSELADMDSLVCNFLMCEVSLNWDAMKNSVYLTRDTDGMYYFEPAWDYDCSFGNSMYNLYVWYIDEWQTTSDYYANETYYQSVQWNRFLIKDPYFLTRVWEKYWEIRDDVLSRLTADGGVIDSLAEAIEDEADANDDRWDGAFGTNEGQRFDEGISELKRFINERLEWMDAQFESVETLRISLGGYVVSDDVTVTAQTQSDGGALITIVYTGPDDAAGVSLQVNGTDFYTAPLDAGTAVIEIPRSSLTTDGSMNVVQARLLDENGDYLINEDGSTYGEYQNAVSGYVCF